MRNSTWNFGTLRLRGLPAVVLLILLAAAVLAVLTVLFFVGLAVAVVGVIAAAVAALFYTVNRRLSGHAPATQKGREEPFALNEPGPVRDIQVDQITVEKRDEPRPANE